MSEEFSETQDGASAIEESASQPEPNEVEQQEVAQEEHQEEKIGFNDPRHPDHERFKELLDSQKEYRQKFEEADRERQTYRQSLESLQREVAALKQPKQPEPADPFLAQLEKVDPAYAKSLKAVYDKAAMVDQLQNQWQQYQQQQFAQRAYSHFDNLLASSKIEDPVDKEIYKSAVEAEVYRREARGEKLDLKDLDKIFNQFHTKYSKFQEERERKLTAKYVTTKQSDTAPTGATGGAATTSTMKKFASIDSPETVKWLAEELRASKRREIE